MAKRCIKFDTDSTFLHRISAEITLIFYCSISNEHSPIVDPDSVVSHYFNQITKSV